MFSPLERVLTVHQTSMGATRLPLELQQLVFSLLDARSFCAARNVCKWWRFASDDAVTLFKQLRKLPIQPALDPSQCSARQVQRLYSEAAYSLMLGMRVERQTDTPGSMDATQVFGGFTGPQVTATTSGDRTVTLSGRTLVLFDTTGPSPVVMAQRSLNDLKETIGSGPWLKVPQTSPPELALSSDGSLLAVAQERTIQIYNLLAEPDSFTVNEYITSAAGHYISGLAFEQLDHLLRVSLSGKGTVLYLGSPPTLEEGEVASPATIQHWKSRAGLRHTFLDSSLMTLTSPSSPTSEDPSARLSGLQLLCPMRDGWLFASQKHGGGESSHYVLGHITSPPLPPSTTSSTNSSAYPTPTSTPRSRSPAPGYHHNHNHRLPPPTSSLSQKTLSLTILTRLESFLSAWSISPLSSSTYASSISHETGMGLWENMPSAHEHHPVFSLSQDGTLLALAERDKKSVRPAPLTQIFLWRVPGEERLSGVLEEETKSRAGRGRWEDLGGWMEDGGQGEGCGVRDVRMSGDEEREDGRGKGKEVVMEEVETEYSVARIPLCLSTVQGPAVGMRFEDVVDEKDGMDDGFDDGFWSGSQSQSVQSEGKACRLSVVTPLATKTWVLTRF